MPKLVKPNENRAVEIIQTLLNNRYLILCLNNNSNVSSDSFGIESDETSNIIFIPVNDINLIGYKYNFQINSIVWKIQFVSYNSGYGVIARIDYGDFLKITGDLKSYPFSNTVFKLRLGGLWLIDTFPFNSLETNNRVKRVNDFCKANSIGFGVCIISGLSKYGSTDMSNEEDAVKAAIDRLRLLDIDSLNIERILHRNQVIQFFSPKRNFIENNLEKLATDCLKSRDNMFLMDTLKLVCSIETDEEFESYFLRIKKELTEFASIVPIISYLNDDFYNKIKNKIKAIFQSSKPALLEKCSNNAINIILNELNNILNLHISNRNK